MPQTKNHSEEYLSFQKALGSCCASKNLNVTRRSLPKPHFSIVGITPSGIRELATIYVALDPYQGVWHVEVREAFTQGTLVGFDHIQGEHQFEYLRKFDSNNIREVTDFVTRQITERVCPALSGYHSRGAKPS